MCREPYHSTRDCAETVDLVMLGICYLDASNQILMRDGSALPQAEGEDGIAKVIHRQVANRVPTPALESFDSESIELTFDSNGEHVTPPRRRRDNVQAASQPPTHH